MARLNGIGTIHLGVGPRQADDTAWATLWFTVFFAPVIPLRRERLRFLPHQGTGYSVRVVEKSPLAWREVLRAYAFSLGLVPTLLVVPMLIVIRENWLALGLPEGAIHNVAIGVWIVWLIVMVLGLMEWHERRFRPSKA